MPTLRAAASFCFQLIDPSTHLLLAPGSLMIDVFIRANYTADSNAMMVGLLPHDTQYKRQRTSQCDRQYNSATGSANRPCRMNSHFATRCTNCCTLRCTHRCSDRCTDSFDPPQHLAFLSSYLPPISAATMTVTLTAAKPVGPCRSRYNRST